LTDKSDAYVIHAYVAHFDQESSFFGPECQMALFLSAKWLHKTVQFVTVDVCITVIAV